MSRHDIVSVLDLDPELGEGLTPEEFGGASRFLIARSLSLRAGRWEPSEIYGSTPPAVGLLVLEGLLMRELTVAGRSSTELLGGSDLLRPWDQDGSAGMMPLGVSWQVLVPTRLAVLDARFLQSVLRWPPVIEALMRRTLRRSRWLAFLLSMKQIMRVEGRLLVLFWALSERWGHVTPRGVHVRLRLTHEQLGRLVGARRPSVTTAIGALTAAGLVERLEDGYLLHGDAEEAMRRAAGEVREERYSR